MIRVEKKNVAAMSKTTQFTAPIARTCRHIALWLFYLLTVPCEGVETEETRETQSVVSDFCQYVPFTPKKIEISLVHIFLQFEALWLSETLVTTYETALCHSPRNHIFFKKNRVRFQIFWQMAI
jgi:hypothetical protein